MLSTVSRPMKSASVSGPIGTLQPSFIAWSISSGVAIPSCRQKIASLSHGIRTLLAINPGTSEAFTTSFPKAVESFLVTSLVWSFVWMALIISTKFITGTGLKKCMPITWCGLLVVAAIFVIEILEVFDAKIVCGGHIASSVEKIFLLVKIDYFLRSKFSQTASTTKSDLAAA
jgi:hypothetical protein